MNCSNCERTNIQKKTVSLCQISRAGHVGIEASEGRMVGDSNFGVSWRSRRPGRKSNIIFHIFEGSVGGHSARTEELRRESDLVLESDHHKDGLPTLTHHLMNQA